MLHVLLRNLLEPLRQWVLGLFAPSPRKELIAILGDRQSRGLGKRNCQMAFQQWFAWYPVWPEDERGIFWLEPVWIRYSPANGKWSYRSFRTEKQKQEQLEREYPF